MEHKFVCRLGIHLKGPMCSRLNLDQEKGVFVYLDPSDDTVKEFDGILQIIVGVPRDNQKVNHLPFLPIRLNHGKEKNKSFSMSCKLCLNERRKTLCKHSMVQRQ